MASSDLPPRTSAGDVDRRAWRRRFDLFSFGQDSGHLGFSWGRQDNFRDVAVSSLGGGGYVAWIRREGRHFGSRGFAHNYLCVCVCTSSVTVNCTQSYPFLYFLKQFIIQVELHWDYITN